MVYTKLKIKYLFLVVFSYGERCNFPDIQQLKLQTQQRLMGMIIFISLLLCLYLSPIQVYLSVNLPIP